MSNYIHGTIPEEQERLGLMNELINEGCLREMRLEGGARVLDVGSGLAQFARLLARTAGADGLVVGVERDAEQLAAARRQAEAAGEAGLVDLRQGDATALPLEAGEWGTFDVAHTRFVLEHVPDPLAVVREMRRAVRPGGRVVLADDDHAMMRFWPVPAGLDRLWRMYVRTYDRLGNDPFVGRRLVALLHQAGLQPLRTTLVFYGGCAGQPRFKDYVDNLIGVLAGVRGAILGYDFLTAADFDQTLDNLRAWRERPDAAFWYAINWAEGMKAPGC
jgi:SAM-dependent methyltransferase